MSVGVVVFDHKTNDGESAIYDFQGQESLEVNVSGELDGADVVTYKQNPDNTWAVVFTCSWRTSAQEVLSGGADGGYDYLKKTKLKFAIENAGASTDISLSAHPVSLPN